MTFNKKVTVVGDNHIINLDFEFEFYHPIYIMKKALSIATILFVVAVPMFAEEQVLRPKKAVKESRATRRK